MNKNTIKIYCHTGKQTFLVGIKVSWLVAGLVLSSVMFLVGSLVVWSVGSEMGLVESLVEGLVAGLIVGFIAGLAAGGTVRLVKRPRRKHSLQERNY